MYESQGISYEIPNADQLSSRLNSVLKVIYLIYNESYSAYEGCLLTRQDLADEAIRLALLMVELLPDPEVFGLAALMLFHDARRLSRSTAIEPYIPLERQDRRLWDQAKIRQGDRFIHKALEYARRGPYQLQAAISALHCRAKSWEDTDWPQIRLLYISLFQLHPSPVVMLNLAIVNANSGQLEQGYDDILALNEELNHYQPYHAARGELEARLNLFEHAIASISKAIDLSQNSVERDFLMRKREQLIKM